MKINPVRMRQAFDQLSQIGATKDGGVNRPSLSEAHLAARAWFKNIIIEDGFEFFADGAGNHFAKLIRNPRKPSFLIGSHLDSVPMGGRFDGALGIVAAYEALCTIRDNNLAQEHNFEVVDFTDEEGTLVGLLGSRALTGKLQDDEFFNPRGGKRLLEDSLARANLSIKSIQSAICNPGRYSAYLELHIEQGPRISQSHSKIGIVTDFVGIRSYILTYFGRADHAGTTPMEARRDCAIGASQFIVSAHENIITNFPNCFINFGKVVFTPGAFNIVPGQSEVMIEIRSHNFKVMDGMEKELLRLAEVVGKRYNLKVEFVKNVSLHPTQCSFEIQEAVASSCTCLGLTYIYLISGAGHDAMSFSGICPFGMIFIPSTGGSHSPTEFADWEDCINGANVLLNSVLKLVEV